MNMLSAFEIAFLMKDNIHKITDEYHHFGDREIFKVQ